MMSKSIGSTGLRWLWLAVVVLVIDLLSKFWVIKNFRLGESVDLLPFFNFYYARNYGAAFSSFMGQRWALAAVAITISIVLMVMMYRTVAKDRWSNIAFALIIGGALGNLFDRLYHGFVVDFFDFFIGDWHYPTFNVADCAICIGAVMVVLEGFIFSKKKEKPES
ncbi:Lipoprotein signal peptidase [Pragia fontium]|uniref:Lipoprotein signal peptidase n=3 Tax=Pragia fontium TaxID=82985 RepID=A0AAJ4W7T7_9GAMM|nr:lipoprotein signal peptidase [Pragia fontium]SFC03699.1 signal peptidase II [Pragia fontium DSM 5563 = ATCC 49100]SUB81582.1 Lipoprotein signal peptidase [Pragia fontium]VEJ54005.1 Lipoprotein signal peptidase [Pragia fontium]